MRTFFLFALLVAWFTIFVEDVSAGPAVRSGNGKAPGDHPRTTSTYVSPSAPIYSSLPDGPPVVYAGGSYYYRMTYYIPVPSTVPAVPVASTNIGRAATIQTTDGHVYVLAGDGNYYPAGVSFAGGLPVMPEANTPVQTLSRK